jgi:hypothetical protein
MSFCGARYLGGVLDFTGELNRYAVARATERDVAAVQRCRDVVDALMGVFLEVPGHLCFNHDACTPSCLGDVPLAWRSRMQLHAAHQLDMHAVYTHNALNRRTIDPVPLPERRPVVLSDAVISVAV